MEYISRALILKKIVNLLKKCLTPYGIMFSCQALFDHLILFLDGEKVISN